MPTLPWLVADIGGTHVRFALILQAGQAPVCHQTLDCQNYPTLDAALRRYLDERPDTVPKAGAFAIAAPVTGDWISMTNHAWQFSRAQLQQQLGWEQLVVVNDFAALALALPTLQCDQDYRTFIPGQAQTDAPLALIGPGTGLGVAGLMPHQDGWLPIAGEGGHMTLAATNRDEAELLDRVRGWHPHVSAERLLSGSGLPILYRAVAEQQGQVAEPLSAQDIAQCGLDATCPVCHATLTHFCALLGSVAGNLVLTLGARGGLYIGGGILPKWGQFLEQSPFRERFIAKGRYTTYLETIPGYLITAAHPTLQGASQVLAAKTKAEYQIASQIASIP